MNCIYGNPTTAHEELCPWQKGDSNVSKYHISVQHFNNQLTHTTLKTVELLKYFKVSKTAPTYFGLQGNHHQGATIST